MDIATSLQNLLDKAISFAPQLALAIVTLMIGFWIIGKITTMVRRVMERSNMDITLRSFLTSLLSITLKVMLLFSVAGMVGVDTTAFLAIIAALMVGIGMAFNGTIGHFASGVMLMIFRPFQVGHLVEIGGGHRGVVEAINAFNTTLKTLDNQRIIVANSNVTGNTITNISGQGTVGVELTFGIGYGDDIDQAKQTILDVAKSCPTILDDPATGVVVSEHGDSAVMLSTRPFCNSEDFFTTKFYMLEQVKKAFDAKAIGIPYPQMDVHMISAN